MDNLSLQFNISAAQAQRAHDAPFDNNQVDTLHGIPVSDPFRPLEKLDAPETAAWVARENKTFDDFVQPASAVEAQTIAFLKSATPQGSRETMPARYGNQYVSWRKEEDAARWSLYIKDVPDYGAPARLLLDPLQIDPSGKTDIVGTNFTRDGKTLAYRLSVSGSDETTLKFMDVATGQDIGLTYPKFRSSVNWDRD
jgi:prolyl oligopeptidase